MAKLGLVFIVVFCIIQLSMAATTHIKRDAPESSDASKIIDNTLGSIKSGIEDTFTKENLSKFVDTLSEIGDKLKTVGEDLVNKVTDKVGEMSKKE